VAKKGGKRAMPEMRPQLARALPLVIQKNTNRFGKRYNSLLRIHPVQCVMNSAGQIGIRKRIDPGVTAKKFDCDVAFGLIVQKEIVETKEEL
jgi:hypothetical protein